MLVFDLIVILSYLFFNYLIVTMRVDNKPIYEDFDWYNKPGSAFGMVFVLVGFTAFIFVALWGFTMHVKLPAYRNRQENRLNFGDASSSTFVQKRDVSPTLARESSNMARKQSDKVLNHRSLNDTEPSRRSSEESNPLTDGYGMMTSADFMGYATAPQTDDVDKQENKNAVAYRNSL